MPVNGNYEIYSDEVQEILGYIPRWIIRWGIAVIAITVLVLLSVSWFVKYPEVISGPVTITSQPAPVEIVSRSIGRVHLLVDNGDKVDKRDVLGYIESTSDFADMMSMERGISHVLLEVDKESLIKQLTQVRKLRSLSLGEVQSSFESLQIHTHALMLFYELDVHGQQIEQLQGKIVSYQELNQKLNDYRQLLSKELEVSRNVFLSDSILRVNEHISERDVNNSRLNLIQRQRSLEDADIAILNNKVLIRDHESRIRELRLEQREQEAQLLGSLEEALRILKSRVIAWKQAHLLLSPFSGTVAFFEYLIDTRFVQQGQPLMTVIPDHSGMFGIVHIPLTGSGRVKVDQKINIRLENYPAEEYGRILGVVKHVSPMPNDNTYSISVSLPEGLQTSYGQILEFRQQMQGTADIITEDLRLLERVFYQFKSLMDQAG